MHATHIHRVRNSHCPPHARARTPRTKRKLPHTQPRPHPPAAHSPLTPVTPSVTVSGPPRANSRRRLPPPRPRPPGCADSRPHAGYGAFPRSGGSTACLSARHRSGDARHAEAARVPISAIGPPSARTHRSAEWMKHAQPLHGPPAAVSGDVRCACSAPPAQTAPCRKPTSATPSTTHDVLPQATPLPLPATVVTHVQNKIRWIPCPGLHQSSRPSHDPPFPPHHA